MVHLIGIPITGTSVNPARSLGPALVVGGQALNQVWLFIVAPLVGGILAAAVHRLLLPGRPLPRPSVLEPRGRGSGLRGRRAAGPSTGVALPSADASAGR